MFDWRELAVEAAAAWSRFDDGAQPARPAPSRGYATAAYWHWSAVPTRLICCRESTALARMANWMKASVLRFLATWQKPAARRSTHHRNALLTKPYHDPRLRRPGPGEHCNAAMCPRQHDVDGEWCCARDDLSPIRASSGGPTAAAARTRRIGDGVFDVGATGRGSPPKRALQFSRRVLVPPTAAPTWDVPRNARAARQGGVGRGKARHLLDRIHQELGFFTGFDASIRRVELLLRRVLIDPPITIQ